MSEHSGNSSSSSTPCTPFPATTIPNTTATWPNLQETIQFERAASAILNDRPHTISSGIYTETSHLLILTAHKRLFNTSTEMYNFLRLYISIGHNSTRSSHCSIRERSPKTSTYSVHIPSARSESFTAG